MWVSLYAGLGSWQSTHSFSAVFLALFLLCNKYPCTTTAVNMQLWSSWAPPQSLPGRLGSVFADICQHPCVYVTTNNAARSCFCHTGSLSKAAFGWKGLGAMCKNGLLTQVKLNFMQWSHVWTYRNYCTVIDTPPFKGDLKGPGSPKGEHEEFGWFQREIVE